MRIAAQCDMDALARDLKIAFRSLRRAPTYTVAAIVALALAIGANTALFSLIESTLLKPYPYPEPNRILLVRETNKNFQDSSVSYPNYLDWRAQTGEAFSGMAAFRRDSFNLTGSGEPERVSGRMVGADFFEILGARPQKGRFLVQQDDAPGAAPVVVLSNSLWQKRFGSDPRVVGTSITLSGRSFTIVGIAQQSFRFLSDSDLFVPIGLWNDKFKERMDHPGISVVARLRNGVSLQRALAALNGVAERLEKAYPLTNTGQRVKAETIQDEQTSDFRSALFILWGAVGMVLLIAAANVANLSLARAAARAPELAIRSALGAGRWQLAREILTESVLLSLAGGVLGVLLAQWGVDALMPWLPEIVKRNSEIRVDAAVLAFALFLSVLTGLLFGALPAMRASRPDLEQFLRDSTATDSRPRKRLRSALVVIEVALSLMLLIGAGLLLRSFAKATGVDPGFNPRGLVTLQLSLPPSRYPDGASEIRFEAELRRRIAALPGVHAVAISGTAPFFDDNSMSGFWVQGEPRPPPNTGLVSMRYDASPGFLDAMGGHLLRGRDVRDDDDLKSPACIIDDVLARKLFGDKDPIGKRLMVPPEIVGDKFPGIEIVGVYSHMRHFAPEEGSQAIGQGMVTSYAMMAQFAPQWFGSYFLLVRTDGDPQQIAASIRTEVQAMDAELPVYSMKTMEAAIDEAFAGRRFSMLLLALFAAVALALSAVGVYGVMSYGVEQRTREIGIRMALGAGQGDVVRMVVRGGAKLAGAGIGIGVLLAVALSRVLRGMLFGVSAFDLPTYAGLALALAGIALLASWLPARRAAKVDPNLALRAE